VTDVQVVATRRASRPWSSRAVVTAVALALVACGGGGGSSKSDTSPTKRVKPAVTSTTTTTPPPSSVVVGKGQTLTSLARFFGVSLTQLAQYNHLGNGDMLTVGQVLQIPPRPPLKLVINPPSAPGGDSFAFMLTGAKAMENIVFVITDPHGGKFKGAPHVAGEDGSVTANYQSSIDATTGAYVVVATGDQGTQVSASFKVSENAPVS
jgi:LysM repeat protein